MATLNSPSATEGTPEPGASPSPTLSDTALLATLPWGVVLVNERGLVQQVNQQAAHWSGATPAALLGQPLAALGLPAAVSTALLGLAEPGATTAREAFVAATAQWVGFEITRQPAGGWVVYGQNITRQKQREQQYQALVENTPDVLTRWTPDLRLCYANAAFAAQLGQPLETALGHTLPELDLPAEVAEAYQAAVQRTFATGQPQEYYHAFSAATGPAQYYVRLVPELHDGEIETVLGIGRDITRLKQAEAEALRVSEARLRAFVETTADTVYEMSPDWRTMYVLTGKSFLDPTQEPRTDWLASYVPTDEQPRVRQAIDQALATGQPFELEHRVIQSGGTVGWTYSYAMPLRDAAGQVWKWFGTARDITARKQAEERQQFLAQLADGLRPLADPGAIQRVALEALRAYLGGSRAWYAEALDQPGTLRISTECRVPGLAALEGQVLRWQDFSPVALGEALAGRPLWQDDLESSEHSPEQPARYAALGTQAWLMTPLVKDGHLVAELTVHRAAPRAWTAADVALVQETTERTWAAVARARAEQALRASEAQFRAVVNLVPDLLWRSTPDSETSWYSQRWYEYTGQTPLPATAGRMSFTPLTGPNLAAATGPPSPTATRCTRSTASARPRASTAGFRCRPSPCAMSRAGSLPGTGPPPISTPASSTKPACPCWTRSASS